jgi:hypothetical protein
MIAEQPPPLRGGSLVALDAAAVRARLNNPPALPQRRQDRQGYFCPDGKTHPSVTKVLGATADPASKARLEAWLERPDAAKQTALACKRGSWVHEQLENHLLGQPIQRHLAFNGYLNTILPWVSENVVEAVAIEKPIWHPAGFSGTFDCLGYCSEWPDLTLLDWKSSKNRRSEDLVRDYKTQLSAYRLGLAHTYDIHVDKAMLVIARPAGTKPDVWVVEKAELDELQDQFLRRLQRFQAEVARLETCA